MIPFTPQFHSRREYVIEDREHVVQPNSGQALPEQTPVIPLLAAAREDIKTCRVLVYTIHKGHDLLVHQDNLACSDLSLT